MSGVFERRQTLDAAVVGREMYDLIRELYPICRSITGNGLRDTLARIQKHIPLVLHEVPTGTAVFDWTVPKEWNIRDAYVKNSRGERVIDFQNSNLHVVNYSTPVDRRMSFSELKERLFTVPVHPEWIPYRTSYYRETWGFCLSQNQLEQMSDGEYEVRIDSDLKNGSLTFGELLIPGAIDDEILISCHACHPSLCNDNLSGVAVATFLAKMLAECEPRYSYRFLFIPGTIGSITWLSLNEEKAERVKHGLVLACLGDRGHMSYKKSRRGDAEIDRAALNVLEHSGKEYCARDFSPYGYDERQYCSPGFNLAVGCLSRSAHGTFPEYHTSADNLEFVDPASLEDSLLNCLSILAVLERNAVYVSRNPKCEPQLGKRGLYRSLGGFADAEKREMAMLWVLNQSDGNKSLLDIAERSGLGFDEIWLGAELLRECGLIEESVSAQSPHHQVSGELVRPKDNLL
jgi:aminopeptidase-like protein